MLFTAGEGVNSQKAMQNLYSYCKQCPKHKKTKTYDIIYEFEAAFENNVIVTPFLIRLQPGKPVELIGDLSDVNIVQQSLNIPKGLCDDRNSGS